MFTKRIGIFNSMLEVITKVVLGVITALATFVAGTVLYIFQTHLKSINHSLLTIGEDVKEVKAEGVEQGNRITAVETILDERKAG